jgi:hypothetical protein
MARRTAHGLVWRRRGTRRRFFRSYSAVCYVSSCFLLLLIPGIFSQKLQTEQFILLHTYRLASALHRDKAHHQAASPASKRIV